MFLIDMWQQRVMLRINAFATHIFTLLGVRILWLGLDEMEVVIINSIQVEEYKHPTNMEDQFSLYVQQRMVITLLFLFWLSVSTNKDTYEHQIVYEQKK